MANRSSPAMLTNRRLMASMTPARVMPAMMTNRLASKAASGRPAQWKNCSQREPASSDPAQEAHGASSTDDPIGHGRLFPETMDYDSRGETSRSVGDSVRYLCALTGFLAGWRRPSEVMLAARTADATAPTCTNSKIPACCGTRRNRENSCRHSRPAEWMWYLPPGGRAPADWRTPQWR